MSLEMTPAFAAAALLAWLLLWRLRRGRLPGGRSRPAREALDTVADWSPEVSPVMSRRHREAFERLHRQLAPEFILLAQVPVARIVKVPQRASYAEWFRRVGMLNVDLLVCGPDGSVLLAVTLRSTGESERRHQRHDRLARVLRAAGVQWQAWHLDELPGETELRVLHQALRAREAGRREASRVTSSLDSCYALPLPFDARYRKTEPAAI